MILTVRRYRQRFDLHRFDTLEEIQDFIGIFQRLLHPNKVKIYLEFLPQYQTEVKSVSRPSHM